MQLGASHRLLAELKHYVIADPFPFVLDLARCHGMWLATLEGREIFDWAGYYGAKLIGHNHPGMSDPGYVARLVVAANNKVANPDFLTPECLEYYRLVHSLAPRCMRNPDLEVYAVNSGAEAVENMMKYMINLHLQKQPTSDPSAMRRRFIYFDQAFHGRTVFALNVTQMSHDPVITRDYHGFGQGNIQVPFPAANNDDMPSDNVARARAAVDQVERILRNGPDDIVGIVVEPLQGAGGHRVADLSFYQGLSRLAHDSGIYLGFDEVQTAGGQTGTFFAIDQFDLPHPPQAVAAAKKLGCGIVYMLHPMVDKGVLDSTWGGSLADMVRFAQEMRIVADEKLIEQVPQKANRLVDGLCDLARSYRGLVRNVRGMGLYQGFSMPSQAAKRALLDIALEQHDLLLLGAGTDSVRLRPNLGVSLEEIDLMLDRMDSALRLVAS